MTYHYRCTNLQCKERNKEIQIDMPMADAGETQLCEKCNEPLQRIYGSAIKPANDKAKY